MNSKNMKSKEIIQVTSAIHCNGSGARLWPVQSPILPKQLLILAGNESLFQQVAQRLVALGEEYIQAANPLIVTGKNHLFWLP